MKHTIIVYMPCAEAADPCWLSGLPAHDLHRSLGNLPNALMIEPGEGLNVALLRPENREDLKALIALAPFLCEWKVLIELPDNMNESLHLAEPLRPRYFTFRDANPEYMVEIIKKMVSN